MMANVGISSFLLMQLLMKFLQPHFSANNFALNKIPLAIITICPALNKASTLPCETLKEPKLSFQLNVLFQDFFLKNSQMVFALVSNLELLNIYT